MAAPRVASTATDPVCGMALDPKTAEKSESKGRTHYFRSSAGSTADSTADKQELDAHPSAMLPRATRNTIPEGEQPHTTPEAILPPDAAGALA